jgi:Asp-tRNA(Asn)/Glu-tRNA(Gln) amidotransferase C subunit
LHAVEVEGVPEYESADDAGSGLRDDDPGSAKVAEFDAEQALAGAPSLRDRSIVVPRFKE